METGGQILGPPSCRRGEQIEECHESRERRVETESEEEEEGNEEEGERDGDTPRGKKLEVIGRRGDDTPQEENADLPGFTPERAHLLLQ